MSGAEWNVGGRIGMSGAEWECRGPNGNDGGRMGMSVRGVYGPSCYAPDTELLTVSGTLNTQWSIPFASRHPVLHSSIPFASRHPVLHSSIPFANLHPVLHSSIPFGNLHPVLHSSFPFGNLQPHSPIGIRKFGTRHSPIVNPDPGSRPTMQGRAPSGVCRERRSCRRP